MTDGDPALSTYRDLIDHLVSLARGCVLADRIASHGHAERTNDADASLSIAEQDRKAALLSMTADQRAAVAGLLVQERTGAIHDVLANLPAFDLELAGRPFTDLADEVPHWDFMARLDNHPWRQTD